MKKTSILYSIALFFCGYVNAQNAGKAETKPAIFSITPAALEHLNECYQARSNHQRKDVSLQLADSAVAFNDKKMRYSIKIENLEFATVDIAPPSPESISVKIRGMKCWVTPSLLNRLQQSTIDVVQILSTDTMSDTKVLILRPAAPIIREVVEPESE